MARKLAVVPEGAEPQRKRPATVKAATEMSERDLLVAMRSKIAGEIDAGVPSHALAALIKQLRELDKEIRLIDSRDGGDEIGEAASTPDAEFDPAAL